MSCTVTAGVAWQYSNAATGLNATVNQNSFNYTATTTNGTGASGTANLIYALQTTIAGGGNLVINVSASPVTDWFGANIVMARVKFFFISLLTTTTASSVSVGNAANPIINWIAGTTPTIKINNGGVWLQGDPGGTAYPVTASTGDNLKILNNDGSNTATLQIAIVGSTA